MKIKVVLLAILTELRKRLINSFIFLFIFFIICYFFAEYLYGFLVDPFAKAVKDEGSQRSLNFYCFTGNFFNLLKSFIFCSFFHYMSIYINANMEIYCSGTLYKHEKKALIPYLILTPILFF